VDARKDRRTDGRKYLQQELFQQLPGDKLGRDGRKDGGAVFAVLGIISVRNIRRVEMVSVRNYQHGRNGFSKKYR
jgi:hypothetical protein